MLLTTSIAYVLIAFFFLAVERWRKNPTARTWRTGRFDGGSQRALAVGIVVVQVGLILGPVLNHFGIGHLPCGEIVGWVGVALMAGGIALRYWASRTLGAFYTRTLQIQPEQQLVHGGPYKAIRHPGYAGALLLWVGAVCATANWSAIVVATPIIISVYVYRIRCEEAMLASTFGERYEAYQAHTWKLVPFIY